MISYWNPTAGNDTWNGLLPEWDGGTGGPKLTIAAAEGVALSGGTVKVTSGIHLLSADVTFAGGMTYTSESKTSPSTIDLQFTANAQFIALVSSDTYFDSLNLLGADFGSFHNSAFNLENSGGSKTLFTKCTLEAQKTSNNTGSCFGSTFGDLNPANVEMVGCVIKPKALVAQGTFEYESLFHGRAQADIFTLRNCTIKIPSDNLSATLDGDTGVLTLESCLVSDDSGVLNADNFGANRVETDVLWENVINRTDTSLLFIDPENNNLALLPNSPAITAGGGKNYPDTADFATDGVKWLDFNEAGGTGSGLDFNNPVRSYAEWQAAFATGDIWVVKEGVHDKGSGSWIFPAGALTMIGQETDPTKCSLKITAGVNQVFYGDIATTGTEATFINLKFEGAYGGNPVNGIFYRFDVVSVHGCFLDCNPLHGGRIFQTCPDCEIIGTILTENGLNVSLAQNASTRLKAIGCTVPLTTILFETGTILELAQGIIATKVPISWGSNANVQGCFGLTGSTSIHASADVTLVDDFLLVDPANNNLNLLPNSPAITSGGGFTPDWYLDLSIGGTGGAGTSGSPWQSFADVPSIDAITYFVGDIIAVTGGTISGSQTVKSGYDYRSATANKQVVDTGSGYRLQQEASNYDTYYRNLRFDFGTNGGFFGYVATGTQTVKDVFESCLVFGDSTDNLFYSDRTLELINTSVGGTCIPQNNHGIIWARGSLVSRSLLVENCNFYLDCALAHANNKFAGNYTSAQVVLKNSIIVLNETTGNTFSDGVSGTFTTTDVSIFGDTPSEIGTNNGNPLFIDPANGNFNLLPNSPAITAGA